MRGCREQTMMNTKARAKATLLDGSMGQEIINRGGKAAYGQWAVAALIDTPDMVRAIHLDYLQAGADVITTNSYGTTRTRLRHSGREREFERLLQRAGQLAQQAREAYGAPHVRIAASLPPLEASYIHTFQLSYEQTVAQFREMMHILQPYVDIFLGETFSTTFEARAFLDAAQPQTKTSWLALTLQDHGQTVLRGGESLAQALAAIRANPPDALLINCCTPDSIHAALPLLRAAGLPFGAYANGFREIPETWDAEDGVAGLSARAELSPDAYASEVARWLQGGASIVGGCCELGPAHIARLRLLLDSGRYMQMDEPIVGKGIKP